MRKVLSLVLALSMVLGMFSFAFATTLSDIDGEYYQAAVEALVELGVVNGYPDGTYGAEKVVTRAELAKMLVISLGQESAAKIAKGATQFADVPADHWASGYINVAAQSKLVVGYPDGTFAPEATVTYAEAVTMVLRALGYKNVVEVSGTWPTNYITKANELQLLRDMKNVDADAGAKRGNVAILLWNMLRTEMWAIDAENQTNGMTYRKTDEPMLNIKFPDYEYEDDAIFVSYDVDGTKVEVTVDVDGMILTAEVKSADLLRLVAGMKVAYLYNSDEKVFLTLTCTDTVVEGRVDKNGKLNGKEYTGIAAADADKYLVALIDGKNVVERVELPDGGEEIDGKNLTLKKAQKTITEDVLVIIDGEWATGEDLREGDVYTKIDAHPSNTGDAFYVVARDRAEGTFESVTIEEDAENMRAFIEVDGTEYDVVGADPIVYEYDEKNEEYKELANAFTTDFADLFGKKGKFLDEDVELALNYLGDVINMYFGEVKDSEDSDIRFLVATGNHAWFESSKGGMKYYYDMTDVNGDEDTQLFSSDFGKPMVDFIEGEGGLYKFLTRYYENNTKDEAKLRSFILGALVSYANLNDDEELEPVKPADFAKEWFEGYAVPVAPDTEVLNKDNYLTDDGSGDTYKVTKSTKVIAITPVLDDDEVVGLEVAVAEGADALDGVTEARFFVEVDGDGNPKARVSYVFVTEDAKSSELTFGVYNSYRTSRGIEYVTVDGEEYELDDKNIVVANIGEFLSFRVNDDDVATIKEVLNATDNIYGQVVTNVDDELVDVNDALFVDTESEAAEDTYKKTTFVVLNVSTNKDDEVEFEDADVLGTGIAKASFKKGDRIVTLTEDDVVVLVRGLKAEDVVVAGVVQP